LCRLARTGVLAAALTAAGVLVPDRIVGQSGFGQALAREPVNLRIIAFNDFHGHLEPGDNAVLVPHPDDPARRVALRSGGAAYLARRIDELRASRRNSVVVSSGDLIGASPLSSGLFHDEPTIEVMNAIGIDLNAVGNHEFDHGAAELQRIIRGGCRSDSDGVRASCASRDGNYEGARFAFIAANVHGRDGQPLFAPALVREIDGVRVGFIGAVTRSTPGIVRADGVAGLRFGAEAAAINAAATALRAAGVQALVAVIHEGGETDGSYDDCANPRGAIFDIERALDSTIDIVLSAHTHRGYNCRIGERLVIQAASFGRLVSVIDLTLDPTTGKIVRSATQARNLPVPNGLDEDARLREAYPPLTPHAGVAKIVEHYRQRAAPLAERTVGRLAATFDRNATAGGDHALGRLIADAQLAATRAAGAEIAFTNPGGIRTELKPRTDGRVTYADLYAAQPFGNTLVTLTLNGAQLRTLLEQQWGAGGRLRILQPSRGLTYAWDPSRPAGERIVASSLRLNGRTIDADQRLRVTVNDFLVSGGDGFRVLREGSEVTGGPLDIDALAEHVRRLSSAEPLRPDRQARITRVE
jgi:5'-nucleotidase